MVRVTSLHTVASAARVLHVSRARVASMIRAGQLTTVTPAGCAHLRITGASILALAGKAPKDTVDYANVEALLDRPRAAGESALSEFFEVVGL